MLPTPAGGLWRDNRPAARACATLPTERLTRHGSGCERRPASRGAAHGRDTIARDAAATCLVLHMWQTAGVHGAKNGVSRFEPEANGRPAPLQQRRDRDATQRALYPTTADGVIGFMKEREARTTRRCCRCWTTQSLGARHVLNGVRTRSPARAMQVPMVCGGCRRGSPPARRRLAWARGPAKPGARHLSTRLGCAVQTAVRAQLRHRRVAGPSPSPSVRPGELLAVRISRHFARFANTRSRRARGSGAAVARGVVEHDRSSYVKARAARSTRGRARPSGRCRRSQRRRRWVARSQPTTHRARPRRTDDIHREKLFERSDQVLWIKAVSTRNV